MGVFHFGGRDIREQSLARNETESIQVVCRGQFCKIYIVLQSLFVDLKEAQFMVTKAMLWHSHHIIAMSGRGNNIAELRDGSLTVDHHIISSSL